MKKGLSFLLASILCMSANVEFVHAQFNMPAVSTEVDLKIDPETLGPNQNATASVESYSTNLDAAQILWKVNGKSVASGTGLKSINFTTADTNKSTVIDVLIHTKEGQDIEKNFTIKPTQVDLVWQASGYTPPFYKGKTLFSHQDRIQFVAIPHILSSSGKEVPPENLIYKWTRNGTVAGDFSGYGKNTYTVVSSIISRPLDVSVEVTSPNDDGVGYAEITATPADPSILFYERNPLYGIQFQKALTGSVPMTESKEIQLLAAPFNFGVTDINSPEITFNWSINGQEIDSGYSSPIRVFRQQDDKYGMSRIDVSILDSSKILQTASDGFNLVFGK